MDIMIMPKPLKGKIKAVDSKSHVHRLLIAAALTKDPAKVVTVTTSDDIEATRSCLAELENDHPVFQCKESGSTLRFMMPISMALKERAVFRCKGRLPERPVSPLKEAMEAHGCSFSKRMDGWELDGRLGSGDYFIPGDVSSQYVTGLLFALPLLAGHSAIRLTSPLQSESYVDMTIKTLEDSGIKIETRAPAKDGSCNTAAGEFPGGSYLVPGRQKYRAPLSVRPEGDWSNSAFWYAANKMSSRNNIVCTGLSSGSLQGDKKIGKFLSLLPGNIDVSDTPDLVPPIAAAAALTSGTTLIKGASRLRLKESDRLRTVSQTLSDLGADIKELSEGLEIKGKNILTGGTVSGSGDHRIVMMAAIAASVCQTPVIISGAQAVNKSYPSFFDDFKKLGGEAIEI